MTTELQSASGVGSRVGVGLLVLLLLAASIAGAEALRFDCDDAYIAFRFVANAHDGRGLVWNSAAFDPVEGYSCFSWVMLLWAIWSWFGVEPPVAAVAVSFVCGVLQFGLVSYVLLTMRSAGGERAAPWLALCSLAAVVGSRTWLQWWSGGLETPLFVLCVLAWTLLAFRMHRPAARPLAVWSLLAAGIATTRPDGLLFCVATCALAGIWWLRGRIVFGALVIGLAPLLLVVAHVAFRRLYYGEWLPNTYYAKVSAAWPEAGLRYFASFAIEHGVWLWLLLAAAWLIAAQRRWRVAGTVQWPALLATVTLLAHLGYYVLRVGGDHFEYRVFAHLVPLMLVAAQRMALDVARANWARACWPIALLLASGFGWVHLATTRGMGPNGLWPIADRVPSVLRPIARVHDRLQGWLHQHFVCLRCNQHAATLASLQRELPRRGEARAAAGDLPVLAIFSVGWFGWVLRDIDILDRHGLCDWVVARARPEPSDPGGLRLHLEALLRGGDRDGDGWLDAGELGGVVLAVFGAEEARDDSGRAMVDAYVQQILFLCASQREDALALDEVDLVLPMMFGRRMMAHDCRPPAGYEEDFAVNVEVVDGEVHIAARAVPLTAQRVAELSAKWRAYVRARSH